MRGRLLIFDDDAEYSGRLAEYLRLHGFEVRWQPDDGALELELAGFAPHLLLLDQRLGNTTGTELLRRIRQISSVPVIIVTGVSNEFDRIVNLELGADDEIQKTVAPRELLARIGAVLRRTGLAASSSAGRWTLSSVRRDLYRPDGSACGLTSAEFETLRLLTESDGTPLARAELSERVFRRRYRPGDRAMDTVVHKLRDKIGPDVIVTIRAVGYAFAGFPGQERP